MSCVRAPEALPDSDFLGAALGGEDCQTEQSKAGDKDTKRHKESKHRTLSLIRREKVVECAAEEVPIPMTARFGL